MLNNNTYIVLKESNVKVFSNKNTNSLLKKKKKKKKIQPKSQKTKDYIKKSNINPLLKIIYLYF